MQQPAKRPRLRAAEPVGAGLGAILLAGRSRAAVLEEILRRARHTIAPLDLWSLDAEGRRLVRPAAGGQQRAAELTLQAGEEPDSWPDVLRIPGPAPTRTLSELSRRFRSPALARVLRAPGGTAVHGLLVARYQGRRPPVTVDRALASLAAQAGAVLENLTALEATVERAEQLSALYETAHELSSELDVDRVLDRICQRARALTGAELAYIMMLDPVRGDGYVRADDGVRTKEFKTVRLALGMGLGGLVAKEGRPYYSSDYIHDSRFVHVVDGVVAKEGVVSVMGVPLISAEQVIGVLFAGYRRMTTFSEEDVAFLESLAEHAAIAMANANLHHRTHEALERERRLHRVAEQQRAALERITDLHSRLTGLVLAECDFDELLGEIGAALERPVAFVEDEPDGATAVPVAAGGTVLGWLAVAGDDGLGPPDVQGLEQAARVVAVHLLRDRAVVQAEYRTRGEFLDELLAPGAEHTDDLVRRASYLGIDLTRPLAVLYLLAEETPDTDPLDLVARSAHEMCDGCLVAARQGGIAVLAPGVAPRDFARELTGRLERRRKARFTAGIADEASGLERLGDAIAEARRAARGARAVGKAGDVVSRGDLGVYGALLADEGSELRGYTERLLAPLLDYDRKQGSNLIETLEVYLDAGGNVTEAARRLILHVNSLYYRLSRIRELGGYDLDDPDQRFELQLALRVRRAGPAGA